MKTVQFPEEYADGVLVYPDDPVLFLNVLVHGGQIYADYTGDMALTVAERPYLGSWVISRLAFRQRFTQAEQVAIEMASAGTTQQAAAVRVQLNNLHDAQSVDLQSDVVRDGVAAMEAGELLAAGRADAICKTPPTAAELFTG